MILYIVAQSWGNHIFSTHPPSMLPWMSRRVLNLHSTISFTHSAQKRCRDLSGWYNLEDEPGPSWLSSPFLPPKHSTLPFWEHILPLHGSPALVPHCQLINWSSGFCQKPLILILNLIPRWAFVNSKCGNVMDLYLPYSFFCLTLLRWERWVLLTAFLSA